jgi:hypothetical protein
MGASTLYFGDQVSGSIPVASNSSYSGLGGYSQQVVGINATPSPPDDLSTELVVPSVGTFSTGDEVMIIIQGLSGNWVGSGNAAASACGYRAWDGRYTYARIKNTSSGSIFINKGTFLDNIDYNPVSGLHDFPINTNLVASPIPNSPPPAPQTSFCHMKVLKVLQYYDLAIAPGVSISPDPFSYSTGGAGILPIRVNGTLYVDSGSQITATGMGYPQSTAKSGDGVMGSDANVCDGSGMNITGTGGACAIASNGAGGGGHGNPMPVPYIQGTTYPSGPSGGSGGGGSSGGWGAGEDCGNGTCWGSLTGKIFMGGAGGSNSGASGGNGGGIIVLMARNIDVASGATTLIMSKGVSGGNSVGSGSAGGGAGGSVLLGYKNLNLHSTGNLQVVADGGSAGSSSTGSSGGGGAGGRTHFIGCNTSFDPMTSILKSVNGGAPGSFVVTAGSVGSVGSHFGGPIDCANIP